mmetsp:Transcript_59531/g.145847  ORF Transcript_59531/g.145847 Transcript_59531/m.145847 type:complete len:2043 (+) Transcript_59531:649-6777(+)
MMNTSSSFTGSSSSSSRYTGALHKLIDSACVTNSRKKWDQVLFYLEGHTVPCEPLVPPFESPLSPNVAASPDLQRQLLDGQGPKRDETPLRLALRAAPSKIIAALCHLGPDACSMVDNKDRLPIHWACRRPSGNVEHNVFVSDGGRGGEAEKILQILAQANPDSLVHRDDGGRTPLHYVFWYHAKTRTVDIVRFLCQDLHNDMFLDLRQPKPAPNEQFPLPDVPFPFSDKDVPPSAAIIPDSKNGALPLHYAVMQGASREILKVLIDVYPRAVSMGDRFDRSPLAWYLGAGNLVDNSKHVSGETNDPNADPWYETRLSIQILQLLVSSKVARMVDRDYGRTPLHWASHFYAMTSSTPKSSVASSNKSNNENGNASLLGPCISTKVFQILVDQYVEAVTLVDADGDTPLHVIFKVVSNIHDERWERSKPTENTVPLRVNEHIDLNRGGPEPFCPPKALIELLLKSPNADGQDPFADTAGGKNGGAETAAYIEDGFGCLPIHTALRCASSTETIQMLIDANPTSLVLTSEELMQTPLVSAYLSEYSAPLQTVQTLDVLLAAHATSRHSTYMDGRLALKMEDVLGSYPIHYACRNEASFESIKLLVEKFNRCAIFQNADGDLPVHSLLSKDHLFDAPQHGFAQGATLVEPIGMLSESEKECLERLQKVQQLKMRVLLEPLRMREQLKIASSLHGMTPLHIAVAFGAMDYEGIYQIGDMYPSAARMFTTVEGHNHSVLELHDWRKNKMEDNEEWQAIRELLFAFFPKLESHRRDEELLDACVRLIRSEIKSQKSFHLTKVEERRKNGSHQIDLVETLSAINGPEFENSPQSKKVVSKRSPNRNVGRPASRRPVQKASPTSGIQSKSSFIAKLTKKLDKETKEARKSIYDADLDDRYVVSPQNSMDGEDSDDFDESSGDELYDSADESGEESYSDGDEIGDSYDQTFGNSSSEMIGDSAEYGDIDGAFSVTESFSQTLSFVGIQASASSADMSKSLLRKAKKEGVYEETALFVEEKKEDESFDRFQLSDVAKRIWCFFVAYNDKKNPDDNYLRQVELVLEDLEFDVVEHLIDLAAPDYASDYMEPGLSTAGLTLRDIACPKVQAVFESYYYFLGRFEFCRDADGILLHRSLDGNTVLLKATEHVVETTEYQPPKRLDPGAAEEAIWSTGEAIYDEDGYIVSRFQDNKRQVYFKFTRNERVYESEVSCRSEIGMVNENEARHHILPLLCHFNSNSDTKDDKRYRLDTRDERFRRLKLHDGETVTLSDFPYAMVHPYCGERDLHTFLCHHGVDSVGDISTIALDIVRALSKLHEKGIVHGGISLRTVSMLRLDQGFMGEKSSWVISDLSGAFRPKQSKFLGGITADGTARFESGLMPPEMFVAISQGELDLYREYWTHIANIYQVSIDQAAIEPYVDHKTGTIYVVRCHYDPADESTVKTEDIPTLPYRMIPAKECSDLWCIGVILFTLCSGGRPLFPTNVKTGHLLEMSTLCGWDEAAAAAQVYDHIHNEVAQDLLLQLLAPYERRMQLTVRDLLNHPFFSPGAPVDKIISKHQSAKIAYIRRRDQSFNNKSKDDWLKERTDVVHCWNFDLLRSIHFSPSEILRALTGMDNSAPSSFLILPYLLSAKNKKGKLAPTTKKDVERAERMGVLFLSLSKACYFGACIEEVVNRSNGRQKWDSIVLLDSLSLDDDSFGSLKEDFSKIAAEQIEAFRSDPMTAVRKLIEQRYLEIRFFFKDAGKAFLYLVDEYGGIPLVGPSYDPYPIEIPEAELNTVLPKVLPVMHAGSMVFRGISGNLSGIVKLIFEAAYPHTPGSWTAAASGLNHILDESLIKKEVTVLQCTLSVLGTSKNLNEDLEFLHGICAKADPTGNYGGMRRVNCANSCLWTTPTGSLKIQEACRDYDFREALGIQAALENKLKHQEQIIKDLQEKVEFLSFRKQLSLNMPGEQSTSTHSGFDISIQASSSTDSRPLKAENNGSTRMGTTAQADSEKQSTLVPRQENAGAEMSSSIDGDSNENSKTTDELEVHDDGLDEEQPAKAVNTSGIISVD